MDGLIRYLGEHRGARRGLSALSVVMAVVAVGLLAFPVLTDLSGSWLQRRLGRELKSPEAAKRYQEGSFQNGDALTDISIPKLGVETTVVQGVTNSALRAGAGHYPQTALPCQEGNVAIAGHRTTYGKPFAEVDRLAVGDSVTLQTPVGACTYRVSKAPFITTPHDWAVVANTPNQRVLTLTTCHPKGSARERLIVQATLVDAPGATA